LATDGRKVWTNPKISSERTGNKGFFPPLSPLSHFSQEDFIRQYGDARVISHADFDKYSKIEPFERALKDGEKEILITGRRADQVELPPFFFLPLTSLENREMREYLLIFLKDLVLSLILLQTGVGAKY